ncbi:hypothetical protein LCGC14_0917630 [marine sediment metagenome]|uniref:Uncharacterized protein n=1 Tax=marine sediment metagenome TaxID=412755 RepID=A0A0F9NWJ2_9ZZZZ
MTLSDNEISKIEGLGALTNLKSLVLDGNKITKIEGLGNLSNLNKLQLNNNNITEIKGLENSTELKILTLGGNPINPNLIEKLGGLDDKGYAYDPQKFVNYCR